MSNRDEYNEEGNGNEASVLGGVGVKRLVRVSVR